ncbi:MAG: ABC transporter ATP-binding protein [Sulfolobales archaeon]|nr:ABC transporter ATP-binding protein [Sulfolobales archaeon]MCX8185501.1 ABC transporter ATP-binding protein [Sulfolobales archaeon]MDW7970020.1 ABC transporter ATP-binding protein [Sulfolobales archaeon]
MYEISVLLRDVWKSYKFGSELTTVLRNVNAAFKKGEMIGIHGPSGSGKTTLLRIIAGLERPDRGDVIISGYNLNLLDEVGLSMIRNSIVSYIPQDYGLVDTLTVFENIEIPLLISGVDKVSRVKSVSEVIQYMGLKGKENLTPSHLSGGERQRVAIARALVTTPSVLLADEPTANLDWSNAIKVMELFRNVRKDFNTTIVIVTHDPRVLEFVDRSLNMVEGTLKEITPKT